MIYIDSYDLNTWNHYSMAWYSNNSAQLGYQGRWQEKIPPILPLVIKNNESVRIGAIGTLVAGKFAPHAYVKNVCFSTDPRAKRHYELQNMMCKYLSEKV